MLFGIGFTTFGKLAGTNLSVGAVEHFYYDNLQYYLSSNDNIVINGYIGNPETVNIPSEIDGLPVKAIYNRAFEGCKTLKNVTISSNVMSCSFMNCINLKKVILSDGLNRIMDSAFSNTALSDITIPDSVKRIDYSAFSHCIN